MTLKRAVLISVTDKTGVVSLAQAFHRAGYCVLSTSGTAKALQDAGVPLLPIEEYTGQREILDGRVKTLHPKIHGGILARRDRQPHVEELEKNDILAIEAVVVNLYPFLKARRERPDAALPEMIELIDVGGPSMLRAAAKNSASVLPLVDPADYALVEEKLREVEGGPSLAPLFDPATRRSLAAKVFTTLAHYDLEIARYLSSAVHDRTDAAEVTAERERGTLASAVNGMVLGKAQELRYGENPHQRAAFYLPWGPDTRQPFEQLQGKVLSYNNLLDCDAGLRVLEAFRAASPTVCILKHLTPCGAAQREALASALEAAKRCDPRSHFGGILVFNGEVTDEVAENIADDFAEIVLAPEFSEGARKILAARKNLRVLRIAADPLPETEIRSAAGGILIQERDRSLGGIEGAVLQTGRQPTAQELADLTFAWTLMMHIKSNAIAIVKDGMLIGAGGGQTSRIDATELALSRARTHGHQLTGAVAVSDAFFPFPDSLEALAAEGITAIISPQGALRDKEVIEAAKQRGISLLFTERRHFRH